MYNTFLPDFTNPTGFYKFKHRYWRALTKGRYSINFKIKYNGPISDPIETTNLKNKLIAVGAKFHGK
jgi:hypothetical protein